jgi:transcription elongation factor Elf1
VLSNDDLKEWQPSRLIKRLLEIAPYADRGVRLTMASKEDENDIIMDETERVLSRKELSKHYHKIGSYLHASFNNDLEPIALNTTSVNKTLERLSILLDEVINSPISKFVPKAGLFTFDCKKCGERIGCDPDYTVSEFNLHCSNSKCSASYEITFDAVNHQLSYRPDKVSATCANKDCLNPVSIWQRDINHGFKFNCDLCNRENLVAYSISLSD